MDNEIENEDKNQVIEEEVEMIEETETGGEADQGIEIEVEEIGIETGIEIGIEGIEIGTIEGEMIEIEGMTGIGEMIVIEIGIEEEKGVEAVIETEEEADLAIVSKKQW